jgi:hypothetical protein
MNDPAKFIPNILAIFWKYPKNRMIIYFEQTKKVV